MRLGERGAALQADQPMAQRSLSRQNGLRGNARGIAHVLGSAGMSDARRCPRFDASHRRAEAFLENSYANSYATLANPPRLLRLPLNSTRFSSCAPKKSSLLRTQPS